MKIFISADMEGIAGVVDFEHIFRDQREHERARMLMTEEVNACIRGVISAGATEVVVNDSHGTMRNLYPEQLSQDAELISGSPKRLGMMEGIDGSYDAAMFIGYHTKKGSKGVINHTYSLCVRSIRIDGTEYGEFGINAMVAGFFDVPVICVSGCNEIMKEAKEMFPAIYGAQVKQTINERAAKSLHPKKAQDVIEATAKEAVQNLNKAKPFTRKNGEVSIEMSFVNTLHAENVAALPMVEQIDPTTIAFKANNMMDGLIYIRNFIKIAN